MACLLLLSKRLADAESVQRKVDLMTRFTEATSFASKLSKTGSAILLASLGAACGSSDGVSSADSGGDSSAAGTTDGSRTADAEGGNPVDAGGATDSGHTADAGNTTDGGHTADAGTSDGGVPPTASVNLGAAGGYVVLAETKISDVPTSAITGNIGMSPAAATYITGFPLTADSTNVFATTPEVTGKVFASTYAPPTPANLTTAIGDMQTAFTDAAGRAPDVTELGAGNIGGMTLAPGVYKWGTGLLVPTNVTLTGSSTAVWIFEIAQNLTVSSGAQIVLDGGALPKNIFWQVAGLVDLGTTSHFEGVILTQTSIALHTGASINGRLLAQAAVTLDGNAVVEPAP